jgi:hypothetical protein
MLFRPVGDNDLQLCWEHWGPVNGQGRHRIIPPDLDGDSKGEAIWWLSSDPGVLVIYEWVPQPGAVPEALSRTCSLSFRNPFSSAAEITYRLSGDCHATLEIFDSLGRRVAVLADGWRAAGHRSVRWVPRQASGIYLCRLRAAGLSETRKLVLTK